MTRSEWRQLFDKAEQKIAERKQAEAEHGLDILKALRMARYAGAEAKANGRKFMSADDRADIAGTLNTTWNALSESTANLLADEWQQGWRGE